MRPISQFGGFPLSLRALHPVKGETGFRWRGGDSSRLEALSDMVFAFALTLLVVSSAPPASFGDLVDQLWGFPGFAAAFTILLLIWHAHYIFFRRYALEGGAVMALNAGLLFLILFFVYPLKYLATMLSNFVRSLAEGAPRPPFALEEAADALIIFSIGYAAVFAMFAALYALAARRAEGLELTPGELAQTRRSTAEQLVHVFLASATAIAAALLPVSAAPFAGFFYFLVAPLTFLAARRYPLPTPVPADDPPSQA